MGGIDPALAQDAVAVAARYDARTAHVETIGTLFNGTQEVGGGSGLLVGDSYVLTNNHVIPNEQNYKSLVVAVRLKSRLLSPHAVKAIHRDEERDLALLEFAGAATSAGGPRCPMPVVLDAARAPMGTAIYMMGFPVDQDLSVTDGLISNHNGPKNQWQTDAPVNPGNSGGPVFDKTGAFVGIAVGGVVNWTIGGETRRVVGVNFLIPAARIVNSPLFGKISALPAERRCWTEDTGPPVSQAVAPPPRIRKTYTVAETKDDHPVAFAPHSETYTKTFGAEPGYRITECTWNALSENHHGDLACNIGPGGASATFLFRLTSGPMVDQWRGWWGGTVTLAQERIQ
ncbi:S1C family serine protease [Microvirga arsenatis]|uniref:Trypsin-like serine protease n=1 Tax=Microvirga arsenatis TaxID=2692265 RepID=A0ABW9YV30_9HYPH|nr:serine protease [Microvirga arsenatis]NBJ10937.1 trypsin-like serine protease [Microvirga arsenatis]NBJ24166.1 trypsin-like serine protease [Microvirga arsenatis]